METTVRPSDATSRMSRPNVRDDVPTSTFASQLRFYRIVSLALSTVFGIVGLLFLVVPGSVVGFFNSLSQVLGMAGAPLEGHGFYFILAVGYMYVVAFLAYLMYRNPGNLHLLLVLINAKSASSILSIFFFVFVHPYLMFLVNGVVDGAIAFGLILLQTKMKSVLP